MRHLPLLLLLGALFSCSGGASPGSPAIPRSKAWPRIQLADTVMRPAQGSPIHFLINAEAMESDPERKGDTQGSVWIDVNYPRYLACLHVTFHPLTPSTREQMLDNRSERMALNAGDNSGELIRLQSPGGFISEILVTPQAAVTPLQMLSYSSDWLISAAVTFDGAPAPADSIRPVIMALRDDLLRTVRHLSPTLP